MYDLTGQLLVDFYRPATTALNWKGLTVDMSGTTTQTYDGTNVLLETDSVGTVAVDFAYNPLPYAHVINVAIIAPRDEPCLSHVMVARALASLPCRLSSSFGQPS